MYKMGIIFLMGILLGFMGVFMVYRSDKKKEKNG